ncbi:MAG: SprT-like domain-containing protein [Bacilli bacterium]
MENKIYLNNQEYIYIITRKKIKNIYFRVKEDLKIHVSANQLISTSKIEKLLQENTKTIEKFYLNQINKIDDDIKFLGNSLNYIYQNSSPYLDNNNIFGRSKEECQEYIYTLAPNIFTSRLNQIRQQFTDLPEFTLKVRKMKSKWGVCNKNSMSITLNTVLITKDIHLIDYVIIHELCHFKHMNHSKEYWDYVSKFYPYYKKARKELIYL